MKPKMKNKTKPLRGHALLKAAWNRIARYPKEWNQARTIAEECRTPCCIAGHCANLSHEKNLSAWQILHEVCELSWRDAAYLFQRQRTMPQLRTRVVKICGPPRRVASAESLRL